METPRTRSSSRRTTSKLLRTPTPKLSERKKSLFSEERQDFLSSICSDVDLEGIEPLSPRRNGVQLRKSTRLKLKEIHNKNDNDDFKRTIGGNLPKTEMVSKENMKKNSPPRSNLRDRKNGMKQMINKENNNNATNKENTTIHSDELHTLFDSALSIKGMQTPPRRKNGESQVMDVAISGEFTSSPLIINSPFHSSNLSMKRKVQDSKDSELRFFSKHLKTDDNYSNGNSPNNNEVFIPSSSFYSKTEVKSKSPKMNISYYTPSLKGTAYRRSVPHRQSFHSRGRTNLAQINKGVCHKIRPNRRKPLKVECIDDILKSITLEKFKNLPSNRVFTEQVKKVHETLKQSKNPIEVARPLNIQRVDQENEINNLLDVSFSEDENEESSDDEEKAIETTKECETNVEKKTNEDSPVGPRKFFKSGKHVINNQYKVINNITATVTGGKVVVLAKKKKKIRRRSKPKELFIEEQNVVNDIIQKLEDNNTSSLNEGNENINSGMMNYKGIQEITINNNETFLHNATNEFENVEYNHQPELFEEFRKRIPYNTDDPEIIERQHILLDFLISNDICTEKNFKIFISEPENHKEEATQIVNSLLSVVNEENLSEHESISIIEPIENINDSYNVPILRNIQIVTSNCDPMKEGEINCTANNIIEHNDVTEMSTNENMSCTDDGNLNNIHASASNPMDESGSDKTGELYPIFYSKGYRPIPEENHRTKERASKLWTRATGLDQYQIDAGQKNFGAKQCTNCGLTYSVHEPEDEKIHAEYHNSLNILRFKGWIDEDVVIQYPEWGSQGRIIRVNQTSHPQRCGRIKDIIKVVDRELGFSSYIIPNIFTAFLAIKRNQVVGLCLVHPIKEAGRYICVNGVDCCTEETYGARFGISRIWVSPFQRRTGIATKLIKAVQSFTIPEREISLEEIAFSSPTEDGKVFIQKLTKREDFLVYI